MRRGMLPRIPDHLDVFLHLVALLRLERSRFLRHLVAHGDLADIVQGGGASDFPVAISRFHHSAGAGPAAPGRPHLDWLRGVWYLCRAFVPSDLIVDFIEDMPMMMSRVARIACWMLMGALGVTEAARAAEAPSKSEGPAKELAKLLDDRKLDSFAARDPENPDQFVAVLYFQGMQMLLVAAKYAAPQIFEQRLVQKNYRDVYIDLNSASDPKTKLFVEDLGADGLHATREEGKAFDAVDGPVVKMAFDGDWKKKKISEEEYMKAFATADGSYTRLLNVLLDSLKKGS